MEAFFNRRWAKVAALLVAFACGFLVWTGCARWRMPASTPVTFPSVVTSQGGTAFSVTGLRIPGTMQELRFKQGNGLTWVPLKQVSVVRFTGPACGSYRPAILFLTGGDRLRGDLFVDFLIEGTTDQGYWNISMREVQSLEMGTE